MVQDSIFSHPDREERRKQAGGRGRRIYNAMDTPTARFKILDSKQNLVATEKPKSDSYLGVVGPILPLGLVGHMFSSTKKKVIP